jgi:hypothetical protein
VIGTEQEITMKRSHEFRRLPGGSIDFDFYRKRAMALRRQALRDGATLKMALRSILIMVAVLSLTTAGVAAGARVAGGAAPAAPPSQQQVR